MTGSDVVFSADYPDSKLKANNGVPVLVSVSKVTVGLRSMTELETLIGEENIQKMIDVLRITIDKGTSVYKFYKDHNIGGGIKAILGVGSLVSGIMKFIPESENPIVKNLEILENEVKQLGEKLAMNIDEVKSFLSEVKFFVKIMNPTSVLMKHLRDCLKHPGPEAVKNFKKAYHEQSPLQLAYTLMSFLEQKSTNPIRIAMESVRHEDTSHRKAIFRKWMDIVGRITAHLLILEAFAAGLLGMESQFNIDQLFEETDQIIATIRELSEEYEDKNYWEEMRSFMEAYIPTHTNLNNAQKADEIAAKLETYFTTDAFYVCVLNEVGTTWDFAYNCAQTDSQLIAVLGKGLCNAWIYRSRMANYMSNWEYEKTADEVKQCGEKIKSNDKYSLAGIIQFQLVEQSLVRSDGLIALVQESKNLQIRSANCHGHEWGPGWWEKITIGDDPESSQTLLVGLP